MSLNLEHFETWYWKRDQIKREASLRVCEEFLAEQFRKTPNDSAIALNFGICLFESGKSELAEGILGEICQPTSELRQIERWYFEACKTYSESIKQRSEWDAAHAMFSRIHLFNQPHANSVLNFIITNILSVINFEYCFEEIYRNYRNATFTDQATRKFFELADAMDRQDTYYKIFLNNEQRTISYDVVLTSLLHRFKFKSHHKELSFSWEDRYKYLKEAGFVPSPFDTYRLSIQLAGRMEHRAAEAEIRRLCELGNDYYACCWILGAVQESTGNRQGAIESYQLAAKSELNACGIVYPTSCDTALKRISCIAICYNDQELVPDYCNMIRPHCDEIVVNDGGSTDNTIAEFEKFASETGFPVHIIRDRQAKFRDRNLKNKDSYRLAGKGGVEGFEADRRRTTTLIAARHPYILIADLDDYFPPFPNMKTIVAANNGIDSFAGSKRELINEDEYCDLYMNAKSNMPTLFKRHRMHVFSGISHPDEYLARLDKNLTLCASDFMQTCVTKAYHFWHLKWLLDSSKKMEAAPLLGPRYSVHGAPYPPDIRTIRNIKSSS